MSALDVAAVFAVAWTAVCAVLYVAEFSGLLGSTTLTVGD